MKNLLSISVIILAFCAATHGATWNVPTDFATIQAAIYSSAVTNGDTILVAAGNHAGAYVTKSLEIKGDDGAIINDGPVHGSGMIMGFRLLSGSDGTTISHLIFTVDLAIMNGASVDNVTVENCTFLDTVQAISNWRGNNWLISHNVITDLRTRNGGGIGILIGNYTTGKTVSGNVVSHNKISGTLHVWTNDGGGYGGSGIVLYADYRSGVTGALTITQNNIVKNSVSLVSDTPDVVDVWAFELTDTRDNGALGPVIFDNAIGFNDFRNTTNQIALTPENLGEVNDISRNLGDSRGHGSHPSVFVAD